MRAGSKSKQKGAATLEFSISVALFSVALLGVVEFSRYMFAWNTSAEATALAARLAGLCSIGSSQEAKIREKVTKYVTSSGQFSTGNAPNWLQLSYFPTGCDASNCLFVEARLSGLNANLMIPALSNLVPLPSHVVRLPREAMRDTLKTRDGNFEANPICA